VRAGLAQLLEYRFLWGDPDDLLCLVTNKQIQPQRVRLLRALGIEWIRADARGISTDGKPIFPVLAALA
jgi:hypothetical protein